MSAIPSGQARTTTSRLRLAGVGLLPLTLILGGTITPAGAATGPPSSEPQRASQPDGLPSVDGTHLVVIEDDVRADQVMDREDVVEDLTEVDTVVADLRPTEVDELEADTRVVSVEPIQQLSLEPAGQSAAGAGLPWGLDRLDQLKAEPNGTYSPPASGQGTHAFVIDSGIDNDHPDFADRIGKGAYAQSLGGTEDCDGHGTHVSGTIGSSRFGVAQQTTIHPVRILDCNGTATTANFVLALNWVAENLQPHSVVNTSIGGNTNSPAVATAINELKARGALIVAAAGNSSSDACRVYPAANTGVLAVGALSAGDRVAPYSNHGSCVDMWAPGSNITSTGAGVGALSMSGTSMAAPHVTGAALLYWQLHPGKSADQVAAALVGSSVSGIAGLPGSSPDRVATVRFPTPVGKVAKLKAKYKRYGVKLKWGKPDPRGTAPLSYQWRVKKKGKSYSAWRTTTERSTKFRQRSKRKFIVQVRPRNYSYVGQARKVKFRLR